MQSHSGMYMTLGKGTFLDPVSKSLIQKNSTEEELLAIDDAVGQILETCHFLAAQVEYIPTTTYTKTIRAQIC